MVTRSPTRQKHPASMIFLKWDLVSSPASLCFSAQAPALQEKKTNPVLRIVSDKQDILFMCLFAPLPSQCLEVWLCLLPSPIAHIPNGKQKYNCFPKTLSTGLFSISVGAGFSQGKGNPIPICVRKQGPENTCVAFEKLQPGFSGAVPFIVFASLYTPP